MPKSQFDPLEFNQVTGEPYLRLPAPHDNIIITPPRMSDAPAMVLNMSDPRIYSWLESPPHPYLPQDADHWLTKIKAESDRAIEKLQRASVERPDGPLILVDESPVRTIREVQEDGSELFLGDIAIIRERWLDLEDKEAKQALTKANEEREVGDPAIVWCFGDYLAASHHGKGIMTAVVQKFIRDWAVPRMGVRQLRVETFSDNKGSKRVFEKSGFVHEKTVPVNKVLNSGRTITAMDILWWKASQ
ncbi:hypothetical protein K466DRAFT_561105 [Polyporus arcularius HHB13444]|uniref:N-acetyltransferase domain-containing protein n=1 Tax=Polyporus arcularius HHB13444 TaxID=1314778 RepID=A0A5C3PXW3_9APHY|nr:hypothetical protein K466DRAFT_561105 [Polyporus arcularius HHB13444]